MDPRRSLPAVEQAISAVAAESDLPHELLADAARTAIDQARDAIGRGESPSDTDVIDNVRAEVAAITDRLLRPVINATGVLLHTNLGRAPISSGALAAAAAVGAGASNLELRMDSGTRGSRHEHAGALLARAVGAQAGIVVNNNAAAVLLALGALARDREVIVSRGELVEIGGGFRVPEIMAESRCALVEVGTTNRTRLDDYERAITPATALLLKVHASNYRMVGFTEAAPVDELTTLGLPIMVDAGSGLLDETTPWLASRPPWLRDEPGVTQAIAAGATVVTFSGDKLLGGPQAGVIVGDTTSIERIAKHPLARAMRADKMTLAALQQVALTYLSGDATSIPLWRMATTSTDALRVRAQVMAERVGTATVVNTEAVAGGGSLPGLTIPSIGVAVPVRSTEAAMASLRSAGIVARTVGGRIVSDLRSVDPADDETLAAALTRL